MLKELAASALAKAGEFVAEVGNDLKPYARGGLIDLQNAVVHMTLDSQQQASVLGQLGQPTPQDVYQEQHAEFMKGIDEAAQRAPTQEAGMGMDR